MVFSVSSDYCSPDAILRMKDHCHVVFNRVLQEKEPGMSMRSYDLILVTGCVFIKALSQNRVLNFLLAGSHREFVPVCVIFSSHILPSFDSVHAAFDA